MSSRDTVEPTTTVVPRFDLRSHRLRVSLILGVVAAYILTFFTLYARMGQGLAALYAANRICLLIVFTSAAVAICVVVAAMIFGAAVRSRFFFVG